ncbi:GPP34 family phosphoprotein [Streptomyces lydicus]|uniref:GPP34 family phosphoprotein n=1 Tax=Streptomyces lydicus TaxID=47763 RepID=UPI0037A61DF9
MTEPGPVGDPVLDRVLDEIAASTHGWKYLARRHRTQALQAVEDQLAARGQFTVEPDRTGPSRAGPGAGPVRAAYDRAATPRTRPKQEGVHR